MKTIQTTALLATIANCHGFVNVSPSLQPAAAAKTTALEMKMTTSSSRRDALTSFGTILTLIAIPASAANAIDACPKGSKNCLRQTWTPPSSTSAADAASELRAALNAYPLDGLEDGKVDGGGYTVTSDALGSGGSLQLEYRSSGKGFFAKSFNGGKPFVDDLVIEPNGSAFEFRSSSRLGDSDFGVNGKRLSYIGGLLKEKGWTGNGLPN
jgi:hypothetical protein